VTCQRDIIEAIATGCEHEHDGFRLLDLGEATLSLRQVQVLFDGSTRAVTVAERSVGSMR
jgi:hypothetical protein